LKAGANIRAECDGCPPLIMAICLSAMVASRTTALKLAQLLLSAGADVYSRYLLQCYITVPRKPAIQTKHSCTSQLLPRRTEAHMCILHCGMHQASAAKHMMLMWAAAAGTTPAGPRCTGLQRRAMQRWQQRWWQQRRRLTARSSSSWRQRRQQQQRSQHRLASHTSRQLSPQSRQPSMSSRQAHYCAPLLWWAQHAGTE
jgi:hypothetical protein